MRTILLIAAVLAGVSSATGTDSWCTCSLMVNYENMIVMVYKFPEEDLSTCTDDDTCKLKCRNVIETQTNTIDLWGLDPHGHTVGSHICEFLYDTEKIPFVFNKIVHGYYQVCGGPWVYTDQDSEDMLCCDLGIHEHCTGK
ncbi:uncharacterized protein LOC122256905 [Penaeus japonicus]|uniref:uncharacterized protein LOC122256905 n=1 Tax=Penaeus japonicus TaxID=27405 RepID=UPI001C71055C|nr:uncharacterized protein LOC122256905 [Penaeus japonicus]